MDPNTEIYVMDRLYTSGYVLAYIIDLDLYISTRLSIIYTDQMLKLK